MKLTKEQLKQIIKEEVESLTESELYQDRSVNLTHMGGSGYSPSEKAFQRRERDYQEWLRNCHPKARDNATTAIKDALERIEELTQKESDPLAAFKKGQHLYEAMVYLGNRLETWIRQCQNEDNPPEDYPVVKKAMEMVGNWKKKLADMKSAGMGQPRWQGMEESKAKLTNEELSQIIEEELRTVIEGDIPLDRKKELEQLWGRPWGTVEQDISSKIIAFLETQGFGAIDDPTEGDAMEAILSKFSSANMATIYDALNNYESPPGWEDERSEPQFQNAGEQHADDLAMRSGDWYGDKR